MSPAPDALRPLPCRPPGGRSFWLVALPHPRYGSLTVQVTLAAAS
jgi:hypothetical protein